MFKKVNDDISCIRLHPVRNFHVHNHTLLVVFHSE